MTLPLAFDILQSGVRLSLICAVVGLSCAFVLIAVILRASPGNERMRQISGAVQEGAKAYLNRQVMTISVIAVIIFLLLFSLRTIPPHLVSCSVRFAHWRRATSGCASRLWPTRA